MARYIPRFNVQRTLAFACCLLLAAVALGQSAVAGGKRWAFVVGVGAYEHFGKLNYAPSDAKKFASALIEQYGFEKDTVKLLTDDAEPRFTPTAGHILGELAVLVNDKQLDKGDLFIFYFSGHGEGRKSGDYLMPIDARPETVEQLSVPVKEVVNQFVKAGLRNVLIIADACRAGEANSFGEELQALGEKSNIAVMLGCAPGRKSYEFEELGQSAFTHFLLKAMADPSLRDPISGAVWASKVAEKVSKDVYDYTVPIKRERYAQKPVAWSDPTRDVLLGAFLPEKLDAAALATFRKQAGTLNKQSFGAALAEYGSLLFDQDRYLESVEVLRTLDQIGEATPESLYLLANALLLTERLGESNRIFQRLAKLEEGNLFRDLAVLSNASTSVSDADRTAAAKRLWEEIPADWMAMLGFMMIVQGGVEADIAAWYASTHPTLNPKSRIALYMEAEWHSIKDRHDEAIKAYRAALAAPGDNPEANVLYNALFVAVINAGRGDLGDAVIDEAIDKSGAGPDWQIRKARRLWLSGDQEKGMALFKEALPNCSSGIDVLESLESFGIAAIPLADEFAKLAEKHPYSWRMQLAAALTKGLTGGQQKSIEAVFAASKFADDPVEFNFAAAAILNVMLTELYSKDAVKLVDMMAFMKAMCNELTPLADQFTSDPDNWLLYCQFMLGDGRQHILANVLRRKLYPLASVPTDLRLVALASFINVGEFQTARDYYQAGGIAGYEQKDAAMLMALMEALYGDVARAEKLLTKDVEEESSFGDLGTGLRAYILARQGKKDEAKKRIVSVASSQIGATYALAGLALDVLGESDAAVESMMKSIGSIQPFLLFVQSKAAERTHALLLKKGDLAAADQVAFDSGFLRPFHPLEKSLHLGLKPEKAQYAGSFECVVDFILPSGQPTEGSLTMIVGADGKVNGFFVPKTGAPQVFTGETDEFGNFDGVVKGLEGGDWKVFAKLAPAESWKRVADFAEYGQLLRLVTPQGAVGLWLAKPKKAGPLN